MCPVHLVRGIFLRIYASRDRVYTICFNLPRVPSACVYTNCLHRVLAKRFYKVYSFAVGHSRLLHRQLREESRITTSRRAHLTHLNSSAIQDMSASRSE